MLVMLTSFNLIALAEENRWYQIEVIAFKHLSEDVPAASTLDAPSALPHDLIAIAPHHADEIKPYRLEQALYLDAQERDAPSFNEAFSQGFEQVQFYFADQAQAPKYRALMTAYQEALDQQAMPSETSLKASILAQQKAAVVSAFNDPNPAFRAVQNSDLALNQVARSIRRSTLYQLLIHQSWTQPIDQTASTILLQGGTQYGANFELEGTIALRRNRYLHLATDLYLTVFETTLGGAEPSKDRLDHGEHPMLMAAAQRGRTTSPSHRFHMTETRRLRSSELHYIDHPAFGIIVEIRPVDGDL